MLIQISEDRESRLFEIPDRVRAAERASSFRHIYPPSTLQALITLLRDHRIIKRDMHLNSLGIIDHDSDLEEIDNLFSSRKCCYTRVSVANVDSPAISIALC